MHAKQHFNNNNTARAPSLISLMVSVDAKHHVYLLTLHGPILNWGWTMFGGGEGTSNGLLVAKANTRGTLGGVLDVALTATSEGGTFHDPQTPNRSSCLILTSW